MKTWETEAGQVKGQKPENVLRNGIGGKIRNRPLGPSRDADLVTMRRPGVVPTLFLRGRLDSAAHTQQPCLTQRNFSAVVSTERHAARASLPQAFVSVQGVNPDGSQTPGS